MISWALCVVAVCSWSVRGAGQEAAGQPAPTQPDSLSSRYRLMEQYAQKDASDQPMLLTQYQVGSRETVKISREKPQGAPAQDESVLRVIYTERVAKTGKDGLATDAVRRFDRVDFTSTMKYTPPKTKRLEGLTIYYRFQPRTTPSVLSLTDRPIRQDEYERISQEVFLPLLAGALLPRDPVRVGDSWSLTPPVIQALAGELPIDPDFQLNAEVRQIRRNETPENTMKATIEIKGQFELPAGASAIDALVDFTFVPSPSTAGQANTVFRNTPAAKEARPGEFDARGYISKVRLAQVLTMPLPVGEGRLKQTVNRELVLERRKSAIGGGAQGLLAVPDPAPQATKENSWLTYDDPYGRFHFRYPQDLRSNGVNPRGQVALFDRGLDGRDLVQMELVAKTGDAQRDRLASDPLELKKKFLDELKQGGAQLIPGPSNWLPENQWAPLKRKVYRTEFAAIDQGAAAGGASGRIYTDFYVVQFNRNETLTMMATTYRDPHLTFREQAEEMLRTFEFGTSDGSPPSSAPPAQPAQEAPAPAPPPR
jgi:hypothetical protein